MDTLSPAQRHKLMSSVRSVDTAPEMLVRRFLFSMGFRYRLHCRSLPGSPDIVLRRYRACVFVNGCFWHGHEGCRLFRIPKTRTEFWKAKIDRNRERDGANLEKLEAAGWRCFVVWQCELAPSKIDETLARLAANLRKESG